MVAELLRHRIIQELGIGAADVGAAARIRIAQCGVLSAQMVASPAEHYTRVIHTPTGDDPATELDVVSLPDQDSAEY